MVKFATDITAQKQAAVEMERLVSEAQKVLGLLASNDLTQEMAGTYPGELEKIKASINAVVHNLMGTITAVREAVEAVSTGAEEITKGNEDLSQRTSEQASSLEETVLDGGDDVHGEAERRQCEAGEPTGDCGPGYGGQGRDGDHKARRGDGGDQQEQQEDRRHHHRDRRDRVPDQSPGVECGGGSGAGGGTWAGFAVVAAEVRNLAQRSATAAKEIKGLINESIQRVTDGSELVDQSGKTLEEIVGSVKRVTDIIAEITAASQEQASGIDQVNKAIMQMDETTQQNAALVEEATSASQSMKEQAKGLIQQVAAFKVNGAGSAPVKTVDRSAVSRPMGSPRANQPAGRPHRNEPVASHRVVIMTGRKTWNLKSFNA